MGYEKICKICGKKFTAKRSDGVICSPECRCENRKLIARKYQAKKRANKKPKIKAEKKPVEKKKPCVSICPCCYKPFMKNSTNHKKIYCSKLCSTLAQLQKQKEKPKPTKPKNPDDNLAKDVYECEQLNKERKERGERALSYGYYKAYQRQGVIK